jgi:S-adenosylmethionine:tRNA ribosyltransferase-isomerase
VPRPWPLSAYQTVFATEPGSAEMPSAGRPFTEHLVTRLVAMGVQFAPIVLHTGVASAEAHERPYPEYIEVPATTAQVVTEARTNGGRVIAVGTTAVRALESATDEYGRVGPARGWTDLVITAERGVRALDGLLTGFHEPRASHLDVLAAFAEDELLGRCYSEAAAHGYLWHEFGDLNLLLP